VQQGTAGTKRLRASSAYGVLDLACWQNWQKALQIKVNQGKSSLGILKYAQ
jgi:hypothetical protein